MKKMCVTVLFLTLFLQNFAQDESINGNLIVTGNVQANSFNGNWNGSNLSDILYKGADTNDWDMPYYVNGIFRKWGGVNNPFGGSHSTLLNVGQNIGSSWGFQIASDNNKRLKYRGFTAIGTFNQWYDIFHSGNFNKSVLDNVVPNLVYANIDNNFSYKQSIIQTGPDILNLGRINYNLWQFRNTHGGLGLDLRSLIIKPSNNGGIASDFAIKTTVTDTGVPDFVVKAIGNVGIGTSSPAAKIDVEGGDFYLGEEVSGNGQRRQMRIYGYDNSSKFYGTIHSNWEDSKRTFDIYTNSSTNQLKIDASANSSAIIGILPGENSGVGIGTLDPGIYKLAVLGKVRATEIKVEAAPWSDFVFYKDYKLPSLEEVERYIKEKGHLQDIPSAKEVENNGIFLGEMNAKLLQKIEELTLYLIEQKKIIKKQEAQIKTQNIQFNKEKKQNDNLEIRINKIESILKLNKSKI